MSKAYKSKKALVDLLRKRAEDSFDVSTRQPATLTTPAIAGQPQIQQVNWAAVVEPLTKAFMAKSAAGNLAAAEDAAEKERAAGIAANTPTDMQQVTPEQLVALEGFGVDISKLKSASPTYSPFANFAQNMSSFSEGDAEMLAQQFNISPEQAATAIKSHRADAAAAEQRRFEHEKALKQMGIDANLREAQIRAEQTTAKHAPVSDFERALEKQAGKDAASTLAGAPDISSMRKLLDEEAVAAATRNIGGGAMRALDQVGAMFGASGDYAPSAYKEEANLDRQRTAFFEAEAAKAFQGQGAITDSERKIIRDNALSVYDTKDERLAKVERIRELLSTREARLAAAKAQINAGSARGAIPPTATPPATGGWSIVGKE